MVNRHAQWKSWSLREKIGQLFVCGFQGKMPDAHILDLIEQYHIGGVIYFRRNVDDPETLAQCSAQLQAASKTPLLIAIDQEGGMVARIERGITLMPGNMALGAAQDEQGVYEAAFHTGKQLLELGINMNFAPCVDVNNNPQNPVIGVRSYGESPQLVATMGIAAVKGFQDAGVAATIKHFPGHGDTSADSHRELPSVPHDRDRLQAVELVPFRAAIQAGVDAVMTAHVIFPAYEPQHIPATLSSSILTGLLREEIRFDGVISTDCMEMNAISKTIGVGQGAVQAVLAGADLLLISHRWELQVEGIEAIVRAMEQGIITEERIDQSLERIMRLKQRRRILEKEAAQRKRNEGDSAMNVAERLSERSITLVKDEYGSVPIKPGTELFCVWPEVRVGTEVDEVIAQDVTLGKALADLGFTVHEQRIGIEPTEEEIERVINDSAPFRQIIVGTYNASFSIGQQQIIQNLAARPNVQLIVAALRNPFDLNAFPDVPCYIASYENKPLAMHSLAKVLTGARPASGKLPVTVGPYKAGWGLTR